MCSWNIAKCVLHDHFNSKIPCCFDSLMFAVSRRFVWCSVVTANSLKLFSTQFLDEFTWVEGAQMVCSVICGDLQEEQYMLMQTLNSAWMRLSTEKGSHYIWCCIEYNFAFKSISQWKESMLCEVSCDSDAYLNIGTLCGLWHPWFFCDFMSFSNSELRFLLFLNIVQLYSK